ncbi:AsmA family protein [Kistimonas asteriae]|uniref:DUF748 domain-containing protein n=1 Tax=Kistimonas asteriae TaxID=517724 RepID=UPI001BA7323E|nr:AsmA family protein [Kistimonas asteriae]
MSIKKTVSIALVAIVALMVLVVVITLRNLDGIVKDVIETTGSKITGTPVTLNSVKITLRDGRGELNQLAIANPKGFESPDIFSMNAIALQVSPKSLSGPVVVINEILVDGMDITAEQKGATTNIQTLLKDIKERSAKKPAGEEEKPAEPAKKEEGADIRLMVENLSFTNATLKLMTEDKGDHTLKMPNIVMTNLGDKTTGLTPDELSEEILNRLLAQTEKVVADRLQDIARKKLEEELSKKLSDKDKENLNKLKSLFQ